MKYLVICKGKQHNDTEYPYSVASINPKDGFNSEKEAKEVCSKAACDYTSHHWFVVPVEYKCVVHPAPPPPPPPEPVVCWLRYAV